MRVYTTEFKLEVVQSFTAGEGGAKVWRQPTANFRQTLSLGADRAVGVAHGLLQVVDRQTVPTHRLINFINGDLPHVFCRDNSRGEKRAGVLK